MSELYALGMVFRELAELVVARPNLKMASIFSDSKVALNAATSKKTPLSNGPITRALRLSYRSLSAKISLGLYWIRGHSHIGGNERADRISKSFACNNFVIPPDTSFPSHSTRSPWGPGFHDFAYIPLPLFINNLPLTPPDSSLNSRNTPTRRSNARILP